MGVDMTQLNRKTLGSRIRQGRKLAGFTQKDLGQAIGVTYQQIQKYECGQDSPPVERLANIAETLHVPLVFFLAGSRERIVPQPAQGRQRRRCGPR